MYFEKMNPILNDIENKEIEIAGGGKNAGHERIHTLNDGPGLLALFFDSPGNLGIALQLLLHHIKALCQPALAC